MATYLLKKSYQLKDLKEVNFNDLWNSHGVFTTMWIFGQPPKILFFNNHIKNLIKSLKDYNLNRPNIRKKINKLIRLNLNKSKKYNHLLRVAINKNIITISLRKRIKPKLKFNLRLINYKRSRPEFKNLKYKTILKYLSKMDNSSSDIGLCNNGKVFETGTSNMLFVKKNTIFSPINKIYKGVTFNFFKKKLKNIIKKDISIKFLHEYDEIILIGSGKGVASVDTINDIKWKRKSLKYYRLLTNHYKSQIKKCAIYK